MSTRLASGAFACALALAFIAAPARAQTDGALPLERLGIPIQAGSTALEVCPTAASSDNAEVACVRIRRDERAEEVFSAYIDAIDAMPWDEMSERPGEMRFDRLLDDTGCVERLAIVTDYELEPQRSDFLLTFVHYREPVCDAEREMP